MMTTCKPVSLALLAFALAACGGQKDEQQTTGAEPAAAPAQVASANAAPAAFMSCRTCHSVEPGKNGIGPSLHGVVGRKAATGPNFKYSPAMIASGLTWDEATLDSFITHPQKTVLSTRMVYPGMADATKRAEVIAYLKTLK